MSTLVYCSSPDAFHFAGKTHFDQLKTKEETNWSDRWLYLICIEVNFILETESLYYFISMSQVQSLRVRTLDPFRSKLKLSTWEFLRCVVHRDKTWQIWILVI